MSTEWEKARGFELDMRVIFQGTKGERVKRLLFCPPNFISSVLTKTCGSSLGITITLGLFGGWKRAPAARTARATRRPRPPRGRGRLGGASSRGPVLVSVNNLVERGEGSKKQQAKTTRGHAATRRRPAERPSLSPFSILPSPLPFFHFLLLSIELH